MLSDNDIILLKVKVFCSNIILACTAPETKNIKCNGKKLYFSRPVKNWSVMCVAEESGLHGRLCWGSHHGPPVCPPVEERRPARELLSPGPDSLLPALQHSHPPPPQSSLPVLSATIQHHRFIKFLTLTLRLLSSFHWWTSNFCTFYSNIYTKSITKHNFGDTPLKLPV